MRERRRRQKEVRREVLEALQEYRRMSSHMYSRASEFNECEYDRITGIIEDFINII